LLPPNAFGNEQERKKNLKANCPLLLDCDTIKRSSASVPDENFRGGKNRVTKYEFEEKSPKTKPNQSTSFVKKGNLENGLEEEAKNYSTLVLRFYP
jgi:hypothetical protein